jgi:hypothetical protein
VTYWFTEQHGIDFSYGYDKAVFWRDDEGPAADDYTGGIGVLQYNYRFNPRTTGNIAYTFANRDFEGLSLTEDYRVHTFTLGFDHPFTSDLTLSLNAGFLVQQNESSPNEDGLVYSLLLTKTLERGTFTFGGQGGYDEEFLDAQRRGFTQFWGLDTSFDYQLMQNLNTYARASFRSSSGQDDRTFDDWRANIGLSWTFLRSFSLTLDYRYAQRGSNVPTDEFTANNVMLFFTWGNLYRL